MICCSHLFRQDNLESRSVICLQWVLPLRIVVALNIIANAGFVIWRIWAVRPIGLRLTMVLAIHLFLCWIMLREGQRSVEYHRRLRQNVSAP
ncbi:hypothetical protein ACOHYD_04740 [Desulfobacterota bacterium M19]